MVKEKLKFYVFLDDINISIKNNLLRLKNVNIIIDNDQIEIASYQFTEIIKFAKKNKIPFFVKNDYRVAVKYQSNGVFLTSDNKSLIKPILLNKYLIECSYNYIFIFKFLYSTLIALLTCSCKQSNPVDFLLLVSLSVVSLIK